jgi:hypothetical protein
LFASKFGCTGFTAARGGKIRRDHAFRVAACLLNASEIEKYRFPGGLKLECRFVVRRGEFQIIALFGKLGQFEKRAERRG